MPAWCVCVDGDKRLVAFGCFGIQPIYLSILLCFKEVWRHGPKSPEGHLQYQEVIAPLQPLFFHFYFILFYFIVFPYKVFYSINHEILWFFKRCVLMLILVSWVFLFYSSWIWSSLCFLYPTSLLLSLSN